VRRPRAAAPGGGFKIAGGYVDKQRLLDPGTTSVRRALATAARHREWHTGWTNIAIARATETRPRGSTASRTEWPSPPASAIKESAPLQMRGGNVTANERNSPGA
jgi:hypothetical protein